MCRTLGVEGAKDLRNKQKGCESGWSIQNMDKAHLQLRRMELQPWFGDGERQNYLEAVLYAGEMK